MHRDTNEWLDRRVLDNHGELLGLVVDVYDDATSRRPEWLAISTGFFGTRVAVAPIRGASLLGDDVVVSHDRSTIRNAPPVDIVMTIDRRQQQRLRDHYAHSQSANPADVVTDPERST